MPIFFITIVSLWITGIIGWIINIVELCGMTFTGHETEFVIRAVGIVIAPLGAVMGLFV